MVFIILTAEGFAEAKTSITEDKAALWINDQVLPEMTNPSNEGSVLSTVQYVAKQTDDKEILVEYV